MKKYNSIFVMLCISYIVTLLLAGVILRIEYDRRFAQWVQQQCSFRSAYRINLTETGDEDAMRMQANEVFSSIPQIRDGILSLSMWYDDDELMQSCRVSYLFGDYGQIDYPLADGQRLSVKDGEDALFIGQKYLRDIRREDGEEFLYIHGNRLHVNGILADITGYKADDRILLFGNGYPQDLKDMLGKEFTSWNNIVVEYFSNLTGHTEEAEEETEDIRQWLERVSGEIYETESFEQTGSYTGVNPFGNLFIRFAIYPVLLCCLVNCLYLMCVYIKSRQRETAIRRMCGISYIRIAAMTGSDYAVIFLPTAAMTGLVTRFFAQMLALGAVMTVLLTLFSIGIMRINFMRKGSCI